MSDCAGLQKHLQPACHQFRADAQVQPLQCVVFTFSETTSGLYVSDTAFAAVTGLSYQLNIITSDGRNYSSEPATMTTATTIDAITPTRRFNDMGDDYFPELVCEDLTMGMNHTEYQLWDFCFDRQFLGVQSALYEKVYQDIEIWEEYSPVIQ